MSSVGEGEESGVFPMDTLKQPSMTENSDASEGRSEYDSKGGNDFDAAVFAAAAAGGGGVSTAMEEIVDHNTQSSGDEAVENHDDAGERCAPPAGSGLGLNWGL